MKNDIIAEQIWNLLYNFFENSSRDVAKTVWGSKAQANELQFQMMKTASSLKDNQDSRLKENQDKLIAEINLALANAIGLIPGYLSDKILGLVETLEVGSL